MNAEARTISVPRAKADVMVRAARYGLARTRVTVLWVLRLVGRLRSAAMAVGPAPLLAWELGKLIGPVVRVHLPSVVGLQRKQLKWKWLAILGEMVRLDEGARRALQWVSDNLVSTRKPWDESEVVWLTVDASPTGAGAKVEGQLVAARFPEWLILALHDNQARREVAGLGVALEALKDVLQGKQVGLVADNKGEVSTINNMRNGQLAAGVADVLWFCIDHQISIHRAQWVPTREMVRRGVDGLSRWVDSNDWTVSDTLWSTVISWAPQLSVDRFASQWNARRPRWNSRFLQPGSAGVDAMAQNWASERNFVCCPLAMVGDVLALITGQRAPSVIIVPDWPGQSWMPVLRKLAPAAEAWMALGRGLDIFKPGPSGLGAPWRRTWSFWAVKLFWTED